MPSSRVRDANGFLTVAACPISSFGIFDYSAGQLGLPGDPNRIVKVYRSEATVSDPDCINSFQNVPFIVDHTMLSGFEDDSEGGVVAPEEKGVDGVLTGVRYASPWMTGDIKMYSRRAQRALDAGKKDLSLGYSCDFDKTPGTWNGQDYEVEQVNMRGNHIALVQEGRVPGARVLDCRIVDGKYTYFMNVDIGDSKDVQPEEQDMSKKGTRPALDNALEQLKALLPGLQEALGATAPGAGGAEGAGGADPATPAAAVAEDPANVDAGASGDPEQSGEEAGAAAAGGEEAGAAGGEGSGGAPDLAALVSQVEAVLAQLKVAVTGGAGTDEGENEGEQEGVDTVEGLAGKDEGEAGAGGAGAGPGKASPGPAAGEHSSASDAALQRFYADSAAKVGLYDRLSKVVGAFNSAAMDSRAVAVYGVKKLKLKCAPGTEGIALDAYLNGIEAAAKATKQRVQPVQHAADAAVSTDELDAYLKGAK